MCCRNPESRRAGGQEFLHVRQLVVDQERSLSNPTEGETTKRPGWRKNAAFHLNAQYLYNYIKDSKSNEGRKKIII
jgi:hypothetical protein